MADSVPATAELAVATGATLVPKANLVVATANSVIAIAVLTFAAAETAVATAEMVVRHDGCFGVLAGPVPVFRNLRRYGLQRHSHRRDVFEEDQKFEFLAGPSEWAADVLRLGSCRKKKEGDIDVADILTLWAFRTF